jgi:hypothetical protein
MGAQKKMKRMKGNLPAWLLPAVIGVAGCGAGGVAPVTPASTTVSTQQSYFGPMVSTSGTRSLFSIDHTADTLVQYQLLSNAGNEQIVASSGLYTALPNGILNIGITYGSGNGTQGAVYNPPQTGNWAVEWPGQVGFVGLLGQPVAPIAPNEDCAVYTGAQLFEFVTLPIAGDKTGTAYGTASVVTNGSSVNFSSINQLNISGGTASGASPASVSGTCSPTFYGHTISVPNTSTVTNPGSGQTVTPSSTIAIGPTGFLVEDNGYTPNPVAFQNILGAGSGAIGFAVPSSPLITASLVGARYNGFLYATGAAGNNIKNLVAVPTVSRIASFGYPSVGAACTALPAPQTATVIYGGEFAANNPTANAYGNCDFAIDLGTQDAKTNGLYPSATVSIGAAYPGNTTGKNYSFPAVAIATQVQGKFAIFVIGVDSVGLQVVSQGQQSQGWGIYLLQSN